MRYEVTLEGRLENPTGLIPSEIEGLVDLAASELETLGADDIDVSTDLQTGKIRFCVSVSENDLVKATVVADDFAKAQEVGGGLIRSAIHAAGAATPDWSIAWLRVSAELDELVDA